MGVGNSHAGGAAASGGMSLIASVYPATPSLSPNQPENHWHHLQLATQSEVEPFVESVVAARGLRVAKPAFADSHRTYRPQAPQMPCTGESSAVTRIGVALKVDSTIRRLVLVTSLIASGFQCCQWQLGSEAELPVALAVPVTRRGASPRRSGRSLSGWQCGAKAHWHRHSQCASAQLSKRPKRTDKLTQM
jgi:hypothetical protein